MYPNDPKSDSLTPSKPPKHSFAQLLQQHVTEAMANGFDDSIAKFKGKSQFILPSARSWFETFDLMHAISTGDWTSKALGEDQQRIEEYQSFYVAYLEHFERYIDTDDRFFAECSDYGYEMAIDAYMEMLPNNYSDEFHAQRLEQAELMLCKFARMQSISESYLQRLRQQCDDIWKNGRQQCGYPSLRGNPCVLAKHGDVLDQHSSGFVLVSTCNCGRMQGRRDDPFSVREANYDFYQILAGNCATCSKVTGLSFAVFEPSIRDFRAAAVEHREGGGMGENPGSVDENAEDDLAALMKMMRSVGFDEQLSQVPAGKCKLNYLTMFDIFINLLRVVTISSSR